MKYVIRQVAPAGKSALGHEATAVALVEAAVKNNVAYGKYLQWFDVNAKHGFGDDRWTDDIDKALKFDSFMDAATAWKTPSSRRPFRDDGKPNRPLTAYSVTIEKVE